MSCPNCNCKTTPCGCADKGLTTQPACSVNTTFCPTPNPCSEQFSSDCIVYTGPSLLGPLTSDVTYLDTVIPTGVSMSEALQCLFDFVLNTTIPIVQGPVYLHVNGTITGNTIPLIWNPIAGDTSYNIFMKLATDPIASFANIATTTNTYATVSSLVANTSYDFYIEGVTTFTKSLYVRITTTY